MTASRAILLTGLLAAMLFLTNCQSKPERQVQEETAPVAARVSMDGKDASCPYLTKDVQGNPVLSWVQAIDTTGNNLLYYATSQDGGNTFGTPTAIPTSKGVYPHDENLSKLLFKPNGDIMALFAVSNPNPENSYAGLVYYTQSFDGGKSWTEPKQLSESGKSSIDERYFDVTLLPNGEAAAVWLDSRKGMGMDHSTHRAGGAMPMPMDKEGSSLYYASTQGRSGFTGEKVLATQLCQCCRTDLQVDGRGELHVAFRGILNDSIRDMMHISSEDYGHSFSAPERISADNWVISGCPHTGPTMAANQNGMHFAWYTMGGGSGVYYCQQPEGKAFTQREVVSNAPAAKHPQMVAFDRGRLALVWDERTQQGDKFGSRIGLQLLGPDGTFLHKSYITPDIANASFPVITDAGAALLVAYTKRTGKAHEVWYQLVQKH